MNRDTLIEKIAEQLKGKLIERGYNFQIEGQIKKVLKPYFDEQDFNFISVEKANRQNLLYFRYKKYYLFGVRYTKTKGEHHYHYWENYTDYYFKDFECADQEQDFDLKTKLYEIEIKLIDKEENRQKRFSKMVGYYNQIKELFGDETDTIIEYICDNRFSIRRGSLE